MTVVFIPRERLAGETRVAATPESVRNLIKEGLTLRVEAGAGHGAHFSDEAYREAGADLVVDPKEGFAQADVVCKVRHFETDEIAMLKPEAIALGVLAPYKHHDEVKALAAGRITAFAMELVPRISRAQSMDVLSSQASLAGYRAALWAASRLPKYFPLLMTAAGTIKPARVVIMGAGVAGLQAIATAKRLGAIVEVSDIREAVKEQVESLGGKFIELPMQESGEGSGGYAKEMGEDFLRKQREIVARHVSAANVVITTALIPGRPAPRLVSREMVESMVAGSVIIDLAVEQGGNCELSRADEEVVHDGVLILAPSNLAATMSADASMLYGRNVVAFLKNMIQEGSVEVDLEDEVVAGSLLTHGGSISHEPTRQAIAPAQAAVDENGKNDKNEEEGR